MFDKPYRYAVFAAESWWRDTLRKSPFHQTDGSQNNINAFATTLRSFLADIFENCPASILGDLSIPLCSNITEENGHYRLGGMLDSGAAGRFVLNPNDPEPFWMPDEFVASESGSHRYMIVTPSLALLVHDDGEYLVIDKIIKCSGVDWRKTEKMSVFAATIWWHLNTAPKYSDSDKKKFADAYCNLTNSQYLVST